MSSPLRCYVVEVVRHGIARPVHVTGNLEEAEEFALHAKFWKGEDEPAENGIAVVRRALCFYSRLPYEVMYRQPEAMEGGAA